MKLRLPYIDMNIETGLLIYFRPDQRAWYALLERNLKGYHAQSYILCFWLSYCLSMWLHPPPSKLVTCDAINTSPKGFKCYKRRYLNYSVMIHIWESTGFINISKVMYYHFARDI